MPFNIYMEEFLRKLKEDFKITESRTLWYKAYADDLVMVTKRKNLIRLMNCITKIAE